MGVRTKGRSCQLRRALLQNVQGSGVSRSAAKRTDMSDLRMLRASIIAKSGRLAAYPAAEEVQRDSARGSQASPTRNGCATS